MSTEQSLPPLGIEDIDRKYLLLEKLGEGGMGEIFKARHLLLEEVRVIKTIRSQFKEHPELQARFLREARVATRLHHHNIATIHDLSVGEDGTACIVMEFVDGINVADRMRREPPLEQAEILEIGRQTLAALGYLHRHKILHRDISPDNIMLARDRDRNTVVKLIDLGIAKPLEGGQFETKTAMFIGKVRYASPEQLGAADAGPMDGRSDLYSLGIVLYELLTGNYPIRGTDQASVIAGHLFHPPREFEETDPDGRVPLPLRRVLDRALAKKPEERFQSAEDFVAALTAAEQAAAGSKEAATRLDRTLLQPASAAPPQPATTGGDATVLATDGMAAAAGATVLHDTGTAAPAAADPAAVPMPRGRSLVHRRGLLAAAAVALLLATAAGVATLWPEVSGSDTTEAVEDGTAALLAGVDLGTFRALVIGNDDYQYLAPLETATRDARDIARVLEERFDFDVRLLLDADRHEMVTAIDELVSGAQPTDNLLIYYAGHGWMDQRGERGYWQPVDADPTFDTKWVSTTYDVTPLLSMSPARRILVIADSCYAAILGGQDALPETGGESTPEARLRLRSRIALTSGGDAPVLDNGSDGHSIFARALLDVLESSETPLTVAELYERLRPAVEQTAQSLGALQRPALAPIPRADDEGGGFYFRPETEGPAEPAA